MIIEKQGNIFSTEAAIIAQGCNCLGVMGAGFAAQIAKRYPEVVSNYRVFCKLNHRSNLLGQMLFVPVNDHSIPTLRGIANCFTQDDVGTDRRRVDYEAVRSSLTTLREHPAVKISNQSIAMVKIGAGLAGGDWMILRAIIDEVFADTTNDIEIWTPHA